MLKIFSKLFKKKEIKEKEKGKISEWSYQRFCGFYDKTILPDPDFETKINSIINLVKNEKLEDINEIANRSNCTFEECVMKIKYLKNKRVLDDYYIDRINRALKKCTPEDTAILEKYYNMIYVEHLQIDEIAKNLPNFHNKPLTIIEEDVYRDIKYLYDKCIINGIKLDEGSKKIIYYTIEKHKKALSYATINCSKCGALVDVSKGGNGRCNYCGSIEEDNTDGKF